MHPRRQPLFCDMQCKAMSAELDDKCNDTRGCCTSAAVSLQYCNVAVQHCTMTVMLECNWHVVHGIDISAHTWASLFCPKLLFTQRCANFLCILIVFGPRILWAHLSQMFCTVFSCPQPPQIRSNVKVDADASLQLTQDATIVFETVLRSLLLFAQATILRRPKKSDKSWSFARRTSSSVSSGGWRQL